MVKQGFLFEIERNRGNPRTHDYQRYVRFKLDPRSKHVASGKRGKAFHRCDEPHLRARSMLGSFLMVVPLVLAVVLSFLALVPRDVGE
jgi:hypothetical protein